MDGVERLLEVSKQHVGNVNPIIATLPAITNADHVSVGSRHACHVTTSGSVDCWGDNDKGQTSVPAAINTASAVWWLAAGGRTTCAISGTNAANMAPPGQLKCWGEFSSSDMNAYEVACTTWGCVVSEAASGGTAKTSFTVGHVGVPVTRNYTMTTEATGFNAPK